MEPCFQLARPDGARAKDSLCLDYVESSAVTTAVRALLRAQWAVALSSIIHIAITILISLEGETLVIGTVGTCSATSAGRGCIPYLKLRRPVARLCQALLFIAILITTVVVLLWNRNSGIYANANCIAGLAELLGDAGMLEELRRIDPEASDKGSERQLAQRYGLRPNPITAGLVVLPDEISHRKRPTVLSPLRTYLHHDLSKFKKSVRNLPWLNPHEEPVTRQTTIWLRIPTLAAFWLSLAGLIILIFYYYIVDKESGFERFMNSQGFGPRFIMTAAGVLINVYWNRIERGPLPIPLP